MTYCLSGDELAGCGEYGVNVSRESFTLFGDDAFDYIHGNTDEEPRHVIDVHGYTYNPISDEIIERDGHDRAYFGVYKGYAEFLIEDIPKIRAALDAVERHHTGGVIPPSVYVEGHKDGYKLGTKHGIDQVKEHMYQLGQTIKEDIDGYVEELNQHEPIFNYERG